MKTVLIVSALLAGCASSPVAKIGPNKVVLKSGKELVDVGYAIEEIGSLKNVQGDTIQLFTAMPCDECDVDAELVIYNLRTDKMLKTARPKKSRLSDTEVNGFFGNCVGMKTPSVILLMSAWQTGQWEYSKNTIEFNAEGNPVAKETSLEKTSLAKELKMYRKRKGCTEIPAVDVEDNYH